MRLAGPLISLPGTSRCHKVVDGILSALSVSLTELWACKGRSCVCLAHG